MPNKTKLPNHHAGQTNAWIFEAIMLLLDKKPYEKITISDITNKAGIARRTFYSNFKRKDDVLIQYLANIIDSEFLTVRNFEDHNSQEIIIITFNIDFIRKNFGNMKKILSATGGNIMFLNRFNDVMAKVIDRGMEKRNSGEQLTFKYKMYYQLTGICKIMWDWVEEDMPIPIDDLVKILNCFTVDTNKQFPNVPNVRIKTIGN